MENAIAEITNNYQNNVILVCGLPGAGKSSLIKSALFSVPNLPDAQIVIYIIDYDALYATRANTITFHPEEWKKSREDAITLVEGLLCPHKLSNINNSVNNIRPAFVSESSPSSYKHTFIIIDDNMFYRSMRRTYFNVAREYKAGFAQIHVSCPISECLSRNRARENPVPDGIIHEMADNFEHPDPTHLWENHTVSVYSYPSFEAFPWGEIIRFCQEPIQDSGDSEKDTNRLINLANLAHQFDLQARKAVSVLMLELKSYDPPVDPNKVRTLGKVLSGIKQHHINNIHKLETKHVDPQILASLLHDFQTTIQQQVKASIRDNKQP